MSNGILKKIRVVLSLAFFLFIVFIFLDFTNSMPVKFINGIHYLQFAPSLMKFIGLVSIGAAGFIFVIILTLIFGRLYCSSICPLGTLQDIISYIKRKFTKRKKVLFRYSKPKNLLRYSILGLTVLVILSGSSFMLSLLDPFSNFGKIFHNLFKPVIVGINNFLAQIFTLLNVYFFYPVKIDPFNWIVAGFALAFFSLVFIMSWRKGRLYCNTVCPVGTLLGFISRYSLFRIRLDKTACTSCGKCAVVCKAGCIDVREKELDFSRCVGCMNCLIPCPDNGVKFSPAWKKEEVQIREFDPSKRNFLVRSGMMFAGFMGLAKYGIPQDTIRPGEVIPGTVPIFREHPVTPPGSQGRERFNSLCTACHLCVSSCPTHVLQPSYFEYGLQGLMQPKMDFYTNYCNFECTICTEICPSGALLPLALEEKKLSQLGKSNFVKENCVVYTRKTDRGACSEHCPTKAVKMVPYEGHLMIPEVHNEVCVGCGACEHACPTEPKSIYINGNPVHLVAEKPKEEEIKEKVDYKEDFPF
jgi:ferredoxin